VPAEIVLSCIEGHGALQHQREEDMTTRRSFVAAGPAALSAISLAGSAWAQAPGAGATPAAGATRQAPGFYRYKVGEIEVTAINDGYAPRDVEGFVRNADIAEVRKALQEAFLPPTGYQNTYNTLVLRTGGKVVLVDTGNGDSGAPTTGAWMSNFRAAGFDPAAVDTVIISHFHPDHINGLRLKNGTAVFPKAEVMVPSTEWKFWTDEAQESRAQENRRPNFGVVRRVFGPMMKDVKQYEAGQELVPGVTALAAYGHSPGHTTFTVQSGNARFMILSDTTNHPALFVRNPEWSPTVDQDADMARATRRKLLDMAAAERVQVAFYHAPFPATGHIAKDGTRFQFIPVQWTPAV
jgi:glyoxylase-like metal-dependent hydrolase (beta-lactamase superfamily II)